MIDDKNSWSENWSSKLVLIKKMRIAVGAGEHLREEREKTGQSQNDFGKNAGVSRGTQKAYELESSSPDLRYLAALQGMGVDVSYVLTGSRFSGDVDLSVRELRLLENYRKMKDSDRNIIDRTANLMANAE